MKVCPACRKGKLVVSKENYRYDCGLPYVLLRNVEVSRCRECGEELVAIKRMESLHRAIAAAVIHKKGRLAAEEVRFLRKNLAWGTGELARHMGVDPSTVSRWETGAQGMGPVADRLLRLMVAWVIDASATYELDSLVGVGQEAADPIRLGCHAEGKGWSAEAA